MAWIAKHDPGCFPDLLAARIAARAVFVFCNERERAWLDGFAHGRRVLFETRGADGVLVEHPDGSALYAADAIDARDTTGAGDTFAGAALARLLHGASVEEAARAGLDAAASLLRARSDAWLRATAPADR